MGCWATGSLGAGGTGGDGQSGNATDETRTLLHLWPTGQPEVWEGIPSELGGGATGSAGAAGASITAFILSPESAVFPTTNWPALTKNAGSFVLDYTLDYDATTRESASWRTAIPAAATWNGATIGIFSRQAAAIAPDTLAWTVTTITRGAGQAFDALGATTSIAASDLQGVAGTVLYQSTTLTTASWATNSALLIEIARDPANDVGSEDAKFISAVIELT